MAHVLKAMTALLMVLLMGTLPFDRAAQTKSKSVMDLHELLMESNTWGGDQGSWGAQAWGQTGWMPTAAPAENKKCGLATTLAFEQVNIMKALQAECLGCLETRQANTAAPCPVKDQSALEALLGDNTLFVIRSMFGRDATFANLVPDQQGIVDKTDLFTRCMFLGSSLLTRSLKEVFTCCMEELQNPQQEVCLAAAEAAVVEPMHEIDEDVMSVPEAVTFEPTCAALSLLTIGSVSTDSCDYATESCTYEIDECLVTIQTITATSWRIRRGNCDVVQLQLVGEGGTYLLEVPQDGVYDVSSLATGDYTITACAAYAYPFIHPNDVSCEDEVVTIDGVSEDDECSEGFVELKEYSPLFEDDSALRNDEILQAGNPVDATGAVPDTTLLSWAALPKDFCVREVIYTDDMGNMYRAEYPTCQLLANCQELPETDTPAPRVIAAAKYCGVKLTSTQTTQAQVGWNHGGQQQWHQPTSSGYGYQQPSNGYGQQQPANNYGYQQPSNGYGYQQPSHGWSQPSAKPQYGYQQPSNGYGQQQPANNYGYQQPSSGYGQQQPANNYGYQQPSNGYGQQQPANNYGYQQPSNGYSEPSARPHHPWSHNSGGYHQSSGSYDQGYQQPSGAYGNYQASGNYGYQSSGGYDQGYQQSSGAYGSHQASANYGYQSSGGYADAALEESQWNQPQPAWHQPWQPTTAPTIPKTTAARSYVLPQKCIPNVCVDCDGYGDLRTWSRVVGCFNKDVLSEAETYGFDHRWWSTSNPFQVTSPWSQGWNTLSLAQERLMSGSVMLPLALGGFVSGLIVAAIAQFLKR